MFRLNKKPYFIAEIGSNFDQNLKTGFQLIDKAKSCGAHAVKFQLFKAKKLYPKNRKMFKIFKSIELKKSFFKKFYTYAKKLNLDVSASTFDLESANANAGIALPSVNVLRYSRASATRFCPSFRA